MIQVVAVYTKDALVGVDQVDLVSLEPTGKKGNDHCTTKKHNMPSAMEEKGNPFTCLIACLLVCSLVDDCLPACLLACLLACFLARLLISWEECNKNNERRVRPQMFHPPQQSLQQTEVQQQ